MRHYYFSVLLITLLVTTYLYNYLYKDAVYKVTIDGKQVNFTGIDDFIPPFVNIVSDFFVAPSYKLMSCGIRKSMSQLTYNTMCLLKDEDAFLNDNHSLNETWISRRSCSHRDPKFRNVPDELLDDPGLTRFAFIRDPFDRFISFYLDKCVKELNCWDCNGDMRCVVKTLHGSLRGLKNHRDWKPIPSYMDLHAAPLSWNCNFDKDLAKWHLLMTGADEEKRKSSILQLANILKTHGVSDEVVEKVQRETLTGETIHSTHKSTRRLEAEKQVREDTVVREYLHKIYFFDYLIFPFSRDQLDPKYQTDFWKVPEKTKSFLLNKIHVGSVCLFIYISVCPSVRPSVHVFDLRDPGLAIFTSKKGNGRRRRPTCDGVAGTSQKPPRHAQTKTGCRRSRADRLVSKYHGFELIDVF